METTEEADALGATMRATVDKAIDGLRRSGEEPTTQCVFASLFLFAGLASTYLSA